MKRHDTIVFLGPSLPAREARALLRADYRPPARQGDVFRALRERPRCLVLIDGVFEAEPSVWHHELLAAHAAGAWLFGASSMGALRAAELPGVVTPVGLIARRFARRQWTDDAHVALLHGGADSGFRPLTVPWVNVWATAQRARREGALPARAAAELCRVAEEVPYQHRSWGAVLRALPWPAQARERFGAWVRTHRVDLKADDARACLQQVAGFHAPRRAPAPSRLSSFVRRTRLQQAHGPWLEAQGRQAEAVATARDGTRRLLLAAVARQAGIEAEPERLARWRRRLDGAGLALDELAAAAEALALDELVLEAPERFVSDGPALLEGLALAARIRRR